MRNLIFSIVAVIVTLTMMLALSEVALRLAGKSPWEDSGRTDDPVMHEPDAVLGWRSKAGNYEVPPRVESGEATRLTFLENGRRVTSRKSATPDGEANGIPELILVGGSFTQGWAISDDETFAWKLQERFPNLEVKNYGTGGYGTYQALLTMRRVLPQQESPKLVVYGFIGAHTLRNVAPSRWMKALSSHSSRGHVYVPYVTVGPDGQLVNHEPEAYINLPLRQYLATVTFIEETIMWLRDGLGDSNRTYQSRAATEQLLLEMRDTANHYGVELAVVDLGTTDPSRAAHYREFLKGNGILAINCSFDLKPEYTVPGDGHPNDAMNTRYADCIAAGIAEKLGSGPG